MGRPTARRCDYWLGGLRGRHRSGIGDWFRQSAHLATLASGSWQFFIISVLGVIAWIFLGPAMGYSDTWRLIINTPTTVLTYLLGILILLRPTGRRRSRSSSTTSSSAPSRGRTELVLPMS